MTRIPSSWEDRGTKNEAYPCRGLCNKLADTSITHDIECRDFHCRFLRELQYWKHFNEKRKNRHPLQGPKCQEKTKTQWTQRGPLPRKAELVVKKNVNRRIWVKFRMKTRLSQIYNSVCNKEQKSFCWNVKLLVSRLSSENTPNQWMYRSKT